MSKQELQKFLCGIYDLDFGFIPVFHPSQKKKKKKRGQVWRQNRTASASCLTWIMQLLRSKTLEGGGFL